MTTVQPLRVVVQVEAVQHILRLVEHDLETGIELENDGAKWVWRPSAGDVIVAVRDAISGVSVEVPSYRDVPDD